MKYQVFCSTRAHLCPPGSFQKGCQGTWHLYVSSQPLLFLCWAFRLGSGRFYKRSVSGPLCCSAPKLCTHLAWCWTSSFLGTLLQADIGASHLSTTALTHPTPPTCSPKKAALSAWYDNRNGLWPTSSSALYLELLKTPNSCFYNQHTLQASHLFSNQHPLPLSMGATSFYVDDMFCHFGKCKQTSISLVDIQYPSFLVISRKKGREHTQAWASSVPHKEFSSTQYLKPLLPVLAWNREYLISSLYGTPRARLAGSHVILICFYHSNSKLKQLAGRRQAVNQGRYTTSRFHKRIFLPSSHFLTCTHFIPKSEQKEH